MRGPGLDQDHIARHQTSSVGTAPRISLAVKHHCAVTVGGISQNLVEMHGKTIEVSNVERTEVCMEGIVEQGVINSEIDRPLRRVSSWGLLASRSFTRRLGLRCSIGERRVSIGGGIVGGEVQAICFESGTDSPPSGPFQGSTRPTNLGYTRSPAHSNPERKASCLRRLSRNRSGHQNEREGLTQAS